MKDRKELECIVIPKIRRAERLDQRVERPRVEIS